MRSSHRPEARHAPRSNDGDRMHRPPHAVLVRGKRVPAARPPHFREAPEARAAARARRPRFVLLNVPLAIVGSLPACALVIPGAPSICPVRPVTACRSSPTRGHRGGRRRRSSGSGAKRLDHRPCVHSARYWLITKLTEGSFSQSCLVHPSRRELIQTVPAGFHFREASSRQQVAGGTMA